MTRDWERCLTRMNSLNVLRPSLRVIAIKVGVSRLIDRLAAINDPAELWRELLVC